MKPPQSASKKVLNIGNELFPNLILLFMKVNLCCNIKFLSCKNVFLISLFQFLNAECKMPMNFNELLVLNME